ATALTTHHFGRNETCVSVQPSAEHRILLKSARQPREICKNTLGHVLRQVRVATDAPDRRRINEADVSADQLLEGRLRFVPDIFREQFLAIRHLFNSLVKT